MNGGSACFLAGWRRIAKRKGVPGEDWRVAGGGGRKNEGTKMNERSDENERKKQRTKERTNDGENERGRKGVRERDDEPGGRTDGNDRRRSANSSMTPRGAATVRCLFSRSPTPTSATTFPSSNNRGGQGLCAELAGLSSQPAAQTTNRPAG